MQAKPDDYPNVAPSAHIDDFNFLVGRWRASHRQLAERLKDSSTWLEFDGECECWMTLGGMACIDDNLIRKPSDNYRASTIRIFDPKRAAWSIYWIDGRIPPQTMTGPVVGGFDGKRGLFFWEGDWEGKLTRTRFLWFVDSSDLCRFEQAFSLDAGRTWETNWTIRLERVA